MSHEASKSLPKCYLLTVNDRKSNNAGPILRCASAFAVHQVLHVGFAQCVAAGAHGAAKHVEIVAFPTFDQAVRYVRSTSMHDKVEGDCEGNVEVSGSVHDGGTAIIGILNGHSNAEQDVPWDYSVYNPNGLPLHIDTEENLVFPQTYPHCKISTNDSDTDANDKAQKQTAPSKELPQMERILQQKRSFPIHIRPFPQNQHVCIVFYPKRSHGLPLELAHHCDYFVHIPHVHVPDIQQDGHDDNDAVGETKPLENPVSSLSPPPQLLDVPTCVSIVLHHFTAFANYHERQVEGEKFVKDINAKGEGIMGEHGRAVAEERQKARERQREKDVLDTTTDNEGETGGGLLDSFFGMDD